MNEANNQFMAMQAAIQTAIDNLQSSLDRTIDETDPETAIHWADVAKLAHIHELANRINAEYEEQAQ